MSTRALAGIVLFSVLQGACEPGGGPGGTAAGPAGTLVIVGGALAGDNAEVYQAILGARSGSGPFCVFPTASAEPESSLESAVSRFDGHGGAGTAKGIFLTVDSAARASDPAVAEEIRGCSGFFFVGGVQTRIVEVFRPGGVDSPALEALRERFQAGAVISGSSAGAAIMTDPMIGGGDSGEALQSGIRVGEEGEGVVMEPGLGFLDGVQVDQHHLARGRWGRLVVALLGTPGDQLGFGIDENTALWVRGDTARVVGASGVLFLDVRAAAREEGGFGGSGIGLHLLGAGDQVLLSSGAVRVHGEKGALSSTGTPFQGAAELDLFGRRVLQGVLTQFATATDASLSFTQGGQVIELRKGEGFQARALPAAAAAAEAEVAAQRAPGPRALYAGPFLLSVRREGATSSAGGADAP